MYFNPLWFKSPFLVKTYFKYDVWVADMSNVDKNDVIFDLWHIVKKISTLICKNLYMCFVQFVYLKKLFIYDLDIITNFMLNFHTDSLRTFGDINPLLDTQKWSIITIHVSWEQIKLKIFNLYHFEAWGKFIEEIPNLVFLESVHCFYIENDWQNKLGHSIFKKKII